MKLANLRPRRANRPRLPLTIGVDEEMYAFIEECARQRHFRSVDDFFDAALRNFRKHVNALNTYVELEQAKGRSFEEILRSAECEIVFTRQRERSG
jgi:hypothetical protein